MSEAKSICTSEEKPQVEYRPIEGFPGYRVGTDGSVWSTKVSKEWKRMTPIPHPSGYPRLQLRDANGQRQTRFIHRLVAVAFLGDSPDGMECCHNNGIRSDSRLSNLRWDTHVGNHADMYAHGTDHIGEKNPRAKLCAEDVRKIRSLSHLTRRKVAEMFGVSITTVVYAISGKRWSHVK
jgi:hypothetical protein